MPQKTVVYAIYMPCTLEEYNIGHLWTTCKVTAREADVVKVLRNEIAEHEDMGRCRNTVKEIDFSKMVPGFLRVVFPRDALKMTETSYNAFPRCTTRYVTRALSEKKFALRVDTVLLDGMRHLSDPFSSLPPADRCEVISLFDKEVQLAEGFDASELRDEAGEKRFYEGWEKERAPVMTIFKRVQIDLHIALIGKRYIGEVEKFVKKIFTQGHQEIIKYNTEWKSLNIVQVKEEEERVKKELESRKVKK